MKEEMMKRQNINILIFITLFIFSLVFLQASEEIPQGIVRLKKQIEGVTKGMEGEVGVAVKHLESGEELVVNGETYFPMASVFKLPIFVEVLAQIMEGKLSLDDEISVQKIDQHFGSGLLSDLDAPGIKLSTRNLINLMMMISDNSATDILFEKIGAENVNARLRGFGIEEITVNRSCHHLICEAIGLDYEKYRGLTLEEAKKTSRKDMIENPKAFEEATKNFSQVMKDQSTPRAMNRLLEMIFKKEVLNEENCDYILSVMLKCQTGERRIKGDLPPGTKVAHKTGTIGGTVNNAGIIYLPDGLGHVAITVFSKDTTKETSKAEEIIAQISRFVFDYFYFTTPTLESEY